MPRPEKFTEATRRQRLSKRRHQYARDEALPRQIAVGELPGRLRSPAKRPGNGPLLPFEKEAGDLALLLKNYLRISGSHDLARELWWLLENAKAEWLRQWRNVEVRPTIGEMNITIESGAKFARKLRDWSDDLPAALLHDVPVLIPGGPPLRAVIEHLAHTFDLLGGLYPRPIGRPPGRRDAAQWVAGPLMLSAYRHAPNASEQEKRVFVRECLRLVEIECPDPNEHPTEFTRWFAPVETAAKRGLARWKRRQALRHARSRARALAELQL